MARWVGVMAASEVVKSRVVWGGLGPQAQAGQVGGRGRGGERGCSQYPAFGNPRGRALG